MPPSVEGKEEDSTSASEVKVERTEVTAGDAENVRGRGRRAASNKAWASLMGRRGKSNEDFASDDDYAPERRATPRSSAACRRRSRGGRRGGATGDVGYPSPNKGAHPPHEEVVHSVQGETAAAKKRPVMFRDVAGKFEAKSETSGDGDSGSDGEEMIYNLDDEFEDDDHDADFGLTYGRRTHAQHATRGNRGARGSNRGILRREIRRVAQLGSTRPTIASGGSGMLTGKVPDITQATAIIRKTITSSIRPQEENHPPMKVLRMTSSAPGAQKYTLMKNAAGQLCRVIRATPAVAPNTSARPLQGFAGPSSQKGEDISTELQEKMKTRVVVGDSVAAFNKLIDSLQAELTRVVEDRRRLIAQHHDFVEQLQFAHSGTIESKDMRIRQLEHQVEILQAKLHNGFRREQNLLLSNEASTKPGMSRSASEQGERIVKIEMNGAEQSKQGSTSTAPLKQACKETKPPTLLSEKMLAEEAKELKEDDDNDEMDEEMEEEGDEDFDELD